MVEVVWGERDAYNEPVSVRSTMPVQEPFSDPPLLHHMLVSHLLKRGRKVPSLPSSFCIFRKTSILAKDVVGSWKTRKDNSCTLFVLENSLLVSSACS